MREELKRRGVEQPPKLGEATAAAMRDYFTKNWDAVLGSRSEENLRADAERMGVALPAGASREQMKTAFADHMASRAALAQAFQSARAGKMAATALGKKAEAPEAEPEAAPEMEEAKPEAAPEAKPETPAEAPRKRPRRKPLRRACRRPGRRRGSNRPRKRRNRKPFRRPLRRTSLRPKRRACRKQRT